VFDAFFTRSWGSRMENTCFFFSFDVKTEMFALFGLTQAKHYLKVSGILKEQELTRQNFNSLFSNENETLHRNLHLKKFCHPDPKNDLNTGHPK
jgi:hypothetical protein